MAGVSPGATVWPLSQPVRAGIPLAQPYGRTTVPYIPGIGTIAVTPTEPERERETRKYRINPRLEAAGWPVTSFAPSTPLAAYGTSAVEEFETSDGPADYALCKQGFIRAVVEAKKLTLGPQGVLTQAERYSKGVSQVPRYQDEFGVPFLYSTNGEVIWFHDVRHELNRSRRRLRLPHPCRALDEMLARDFDSEMAALATVPQHPGIWPYQIEANPAIEQAIRDRKRKMLVTMATGTGKTLMMVNEIYRLMKSGVARRVLFLVDRRALAAQAVRAFASFEAEPGLKFDKIYPVYSQRFQQADFDEDEKFDPNVMPNSLLTDPKLGDAFVYVCTIQRMTHQPVRRCRRRSTIDDEAVDDDAEQARTSRSTPST